MMQIQEDHPLLKQPKTRLGKWLHLNLNAGYINCAFQVLLVAFNVFMYYVTNNPAHLALLPFLFILFLIGLISGNGIKRNRIARLQVIQDIISRHEKKSE